MRLLVLNRIVLLSKWANWRRIIGYGFKRKTTAATTITTFRKKFSSFLAMCRMHKFRSVYLNEQKSGEQRVCCLSVKRHLRALLPRCLHKHVKCVLVWLQYSLINEYEVNRSHGNAEHSRFSAMFWDELFVLHQWMLLHLEYDCNPIVT